VSRASRVIRRWSLACLGALVLPSAQARADEPFEANSSFRWDVPEEIRHVDVPATHHVDGVPVRFNMAYSKWDPQTLANYYYAQFRKAKLFIAPEKEQADFSPKLFQLTAVDPKTLVSYTVILKPQVDHSTEIIMGQAYWKDREKKANRSNGFAPLVPGSTGMVSSRTEGYETMTFQVAATAADVQKFYRETLPQEGYRETEPWTFRHGDEAIHIHVFEQDKGGKVSVLMTQRNEPGTTPAPY
jgi:hypothetical protein